MPSEKPQSGSGGSANGIDRGRFVTDLPTFRLLSCEKRCKIIYNDGTVENEAPLHIPGGRGGKLDCPVLWLVKSCQQISQGGLPPAAFAHDGCVLMGGDGEGEVMEKGLVIVTKGQVINLQ